MEEIWIKALNGIVDTVQKWLDQAPAYIIGLVNRYWSYYWWTNIVLALLALVVIVLCIRWIKAWIRTDEDRWWPAIIACSIVSLFAFILLWTFIVQAFKWFYIPEVALINEFTPSCHN